MVPGLETSDLPARSADRARQSLLIGTIAVCAAPGLLAAVVAPSRGHSPLSASGRELRGATIALIALFGSRGLNGTASR